MLTRTNHGALVPLPVLTHWHLYPPGTCRKCGKPSALRYYEINSDYGDERWECATSLGGCGDSFVAEGPDA